MSRRALALLTVVTGLSGCATEVYQLSDTGITPESRLLADGHTHGVTVDTPFANIAQKDNGQERLLRAALTFCDLPATAGANAIKFETTMDIYLTSNAVFACTDPEKDTQ